MDLITSASNPIVDREWRGDIAQATASSSADFRLLVSMLQQNVMKRPSVQSKTEKQEDSRTVTLSHFSQYPNHPLSATKDDFNQANIVNQLVHNNEIVSMRLNLAMSPPPLSRYNDPHRIDDEVVANAAYEYQAQVAENDQSQRETNEHLSSTDSHEPLLFEMLESLGQQPMLDDISTNF